MEGKEMTRNIPPTLSQMPRRIAQLDAIAEILLDRKGATWSNFSTLFTSALFPYPFREMTNADVRSIALGILGQLTLNMDYRFPTAGMCTSLSAVMKAHPRLSTARKTPYKRVKKMKVPGGKLQR
jgi:hypothetical protein